MDAPPSRLPQLRPDLRFTPVVEGQQTLYVVEDPIRHLFFRMGQEEYLLASCLQQARDFDDLLAQARARSGITFSAEEAQAILNWLAGRQLLQAGNSASLLAAVRHKHEIASMRRLNRLNLISFKLPLFNPDHILQRCRFLASLTGLPFFLLWLAAGIAAMITMLDEWPLFTGQLASFLGTENLFRLWLIWFGLKILHEFFHALACYRYGGRVFEAGILIILFMPLTYVNATSSWQFPSKWQRIHVALAGMFIELFIAFLAILFWARNPATTAGFIAHNTVIVAGISSLLFNANPLMRFDGYYVLSDLTGIPNLYQRGLEWVKAKLAAFFWGISTPQAPASPFIRFYGVAVYLWRFVILISLGYLASKLAGGLGIFITLGAVITWLGQPLLVFIRQLPTLRQHNPKLIRHVTLRLLLVVAVLATGLNLISWQKRIETPAVVEYEEQYSIRAKTSGFVNDIRVTDGDQVKAGQVLLTLENSELHFSAEQGQLQLEQLELKMRLAQSTGKITGLNILQDQKQALLKEQKAVEEDIAALTIVAPGDGICISSNLDTLRGTYLPKGQELMWLVSAQQKQLTGAAAQNDIDDFRQLVDRPVEVDMRLAGLGVFQARLQRISPAVTTSLPHPALGAVYGGPLDVRQLAISNTGQGLEQHYRFELFVPRFTLHLELPPAIQEQVKAGQLATVVARGTRVTLGSVLWGWITDWFHYKDKIAGENS